MAAKELREQRMSLQNPGAMTKSELVKYICQHYGNVMLLTHDELMHINKLGLEQYLADLQKDEAKRRCSRN